MWFLVHCYEDQNKIDDAIGTCEELIETVRDFGGEGLGEKHRMWQPLLDKKQELTCTKESKLPQNSSGIAFEENSARTGHPALSYIPPKRVIQFFTY